MNAHALDLIVARHDIGHHPFYRAWREGTLPAASLAAYAADYAPFIESIELGWRTLGEHDHAAGERVHAGLWARFREALGASVGAPCKEAASLADTARDAFADRAGAIGALYAFEAQQPATAKSKLEGLRAHYAAQVPEEAAEYFRLHADEYGEREILRAMAARLTPAENARAADACERTCAAMWNALTGVMEAPAGAVTRDGACRPPEAI
jgi:pyrroloquinoline-quinone synthase